MSLSKRIKYYEDPRGKSPFLEWLEGLEDRVGRVNVKVRIDRLERGNFGHCRSLGGGLQEMKIDYGPGYRVYFGMLDAETVVILLGGSKRNQRRDIEKARDIWSSLT